MGNKASASATSDFPATYIPDVVTEHILSFVSGRDLLRNCARVCKAWNMIINGNSLWRIKIERELGSAVIPRLPGYQFDLKRIYIHRPFSRNLIKNGNAAEGFKHWKIYSNGGNKFVVEPNSCNYADPVSSIGLEDCSHCWVTSYGLCAKSQEVNLLAEGLTADILDNIKPTITFSEWATARRDCGSIYTCEVTLMDESKKSVGSLWQYKGQRVWDQWQGGTWHKVERVFDTYPAGVRYIEVRHSGQDRQFWAGHYGPKITATSLRVDIDERCVGQYQQKAQQNDS